MPPVDIRIPQLGEGLQEARIVRFLKQPGDTVARDEPLFEMETDKAVMEIESPAAGVVEAWIAAEDQTLPIGTVIGRISTDGTGVAVAESAAEPLQAAAEVGARVQVPVVDAPPEKAALRNANVPPRTRAYARERGLTEEELVQLALGTEGKVLPQHVDAFLRARVQGRSEAASQEGALPSGPGRYTETPLPASQRRLAYRLIRSTQVVVPATIQMPVDWGAVERARARLKEERRVVQPSQFLLFCWCIAQAAREHPKFRSSLPNEATLRQYAHLNMGIAVARPGDELVQARVDQADTLRLSDFTRAAQQSIERARDGEDQATDTIQIVVTNMAATGALIGIPVVVPPAVATIFIGTPFDEAAPLPGGGVGFVRRAMMVMTFDHRLANGIGAAAFMNAIRDRIAGLPAADLS